MKGMLKNLYEGSDIVYPFKVLYDVFRWKLISEEFYIKSTFKKRLGYDLNLQEPKTFNEKIQWIKLNDKNPLKALCTDKYLSPIFSLI
jgi:hypothetical protein